MAWQTLPNGNLYLVLGDWGYTIAKDDSCTIAPYVLRRNAWRDAQLDVWDNGTYMGRFETLREAKVAARRHAKAGVI